MLNEISDQRKLRMRKDTVISATKVACQTVVII